MSSLGQTFPPVAVFTVAVPFLGFGLKPTSLALTLYGVLPVGAQRLWRVELPLVTLIINGLVNLDPAITLQGALLATGLALILDAYISLRPSACGRRSIGCSAIVSQSRCLE